MKRDNVLRFPENVRVRTKLEAQRKPMARAERPVPQLKRAA